MDSFEFESVKAEKEKAMKMYKIEEKLKKFLYLFEICVAVVLIPWFFNRIPLAAKFAGEYLCYLVTGFFRSTFYVFLLTNAMVFAVVISYYLKNDNYIAQSDFHDEFVRASESFRRFSVDDEYKTPAVKAQPEESLSYDDKQVIYSESAVAGVDSIVVVTDARAKYKVATESRRQKLAETEKELRRSATELCGKREIKKQHIELRRSATVRYGGSRRDVEFEPPRRSMEEMSSEEFKSKIESFIAMQKRMQLEESKKDGRFLGQRTRPCLAVAVNH